MKLYPPKGGEPITPHPSKIDEMIEKGWKVETPAKQDSKKGVK